MCFCSSCDSFDWGDGCCWLCFFVCVFGLLGCGLLIWGVCVLRLCLVCDFVVFCFRSFGDVWLCFVFICVGVLILRFCLG